jgi:predicted NAD/FAD-binding protein
MDELEFLAYTAGATVDRRFTQKLSQPDSRTFVGSGKALEIKEYVKEHEIGTVIFDDELSPSQLKIWNVKWKSKSWTEPISFLIFLRKEHKLLMLELRLNWLNINISYHA